MTYAVIKAILRKEFRTGTDDIAGITETFIKDHTNMGKKMALEYTLPNQEADTKENGYRVKDTAKVFK